MGNQLSTLVFNGARHCPITFQEHPYTISALYLLNFFPKILPSKNSIQKGGKRCSLIYYSYFGVPIINFL